MYEELIKRRRKAYSLLFKIERQIDDAFFYFVRENYPVKKEGDAQEYGEFLIFTTDKNDKERELAIFLQKIQGINPVESVTYF